MLLITESLKDLISQVEFDEHVDNEDGRGKDRFPI